MDVVSPFRRDSAVSSAAAADRAKKEVVADYDSRREQLEQDRLELEASIREKEVKLEWAIEEERNNTVILKQRCASIILYLPLRIARVRQCAQTQHIRTDT